MKDQIAHLRRVQDESRKLAMQAHDLERDLLLTVLKTMDPRELVHRGLVKLHTFRLERVLDEKRTHTIVKSVKRSPEPV